MTTFLYMRHGKTHANQDDQVSPPDTLLTKEGEMQARKAGRALKKEGISIIVTSPYPRAVRTAEIIAKELKIKDIQVIDDLRERGLGDFEGRKHDRKHTEYYTIDGEHDVEPRGVVIARCEAALSQIKKLSEQGKVLAIGHTMAGYFLRQVAAGKRLLSDFDPPRDLPNASPVTVTIMDAPMRTGSRQLVLSFVAFIAGVALLIVGIWLLVTRPAPEQNKVKQQNIPLSPDDYGDSPHLQDAIQKLQEQNATQQAPGSNDLQPSDTLQSTGKDLQN